MSSPLLVDILAYWNLNNNGSGGVSLVDSTGNGNTLTNNNGVALGTGIIAGDAVFNTTNYLETTILNPPSTGDVAVSFWMNPTTYGSGGISDYLGTALSLCYQPSPDIGWLFIFNTSGNLRVYNETQYFETPVIPLGEWTNIIVSRSSGTSDVYVNGQNVGSFADNSDFSQGGTCIGVPIDQTSNQILQFDGGIDEIGFWNRALSGSEIDKLYNGGAGLTYPFTLLYYNNAENDGDWGNLLNWWQDSGFTTQATALPNNTTPVNLYNEVTQNTQGANQCFCSYANFWSANFGAGLTLQSTGVVNMQGSSVMAGNTTDGLSMHDSSQLTATSVVDGNVVMRDSSRAFGSILGNATIYYDGGNGQYPIGGTVEGSVTYIGWPALSPQYFNDSQTEDGDFNNPLNWWADDSYTTRPINAQGAQELPDQSTDIFVIGYEILANTGPAAACNTATFVSYGVLSIPLICSNGAKFNNGVLYALTYGSGQVVGNAVFNGDSYQVGYVTGNARFTSNASLNNSFNYQGSWAGLSPTKIGSFTSAIKTKKPISISSLLRFPWFINF
jgi:Concanavalin A-like lectin/glucanases superfamily